MSRSQRANAGFTLLEMLIVLSLLGILFVALTGMLVLGISSRARITAVSLDAQDFGSLRRIFNDQLALAYPDWIHSGQTQSIYFDGTSDHLAFLAPALETQGVGLSSYRFSVGNANGKRALLLQTIFSTPRPPPALTSYFALGLATVNFQYFGPPRDGGPPAWQSNWQMRTTPPDLVSLQVTFRKGDRRIWPEIIIHPVIDADVTCEIDPRTHRCAGR